MSGDIAEDPVQRRAPAEQQPGIPEERSDRPQERSGTAKLLDFGRHEEETIPLVSPEETEKFRSQWTQIQTRFVDEPRGAVEEADMLVADVIRRITERFANERSGLEAQWSRGGNVSTEELRLSLQRYRSFFGRLLSQ